MCNEHLKYFISKGFNIRSSVEATAETICRLKRLQTVTLREIKHLSADTKWWKAARVFNPVTLLINLLCWSLNEPRWHWTLERTLLEDFKGNWPLKCERGTKKTSEELRLPPPLLGAPLDTTRRPSERGLCFYSDERGVRGHASIWVHHLRKTSWKLHLLLLPLTSASWSRTLDPGRRLHDARQLSEATLVKDISPTH